MKYLSSLRLVLLRHKFRRMFRGNLGAQPSESTDSAKGKECRQSWITMSGSRTAFIRCHPDLRAKNGRSWIGPDEFIVEIRLQRRTTP